MPDSYGVYRSWLAGRSAQFMSGFVVADNFQVLRIPGYTSSSIPNYEEISGHCSGTNVAEAHLSKSKCEQVYGGTWISHSASKFWEADFLPANQWVREAGHGWSRLGTATLDGLLIPFSTQYRTHQTGCFEEDASGRFPCENIVITKGACSNATYVTRAACVAANEVWTLSVSAAVLLANTTKKECNDATQSLGTLRWYDDRGDDCDSEIASGFLPSYQKPVGGGAKDWGVQSGNVTSISLNPFPSGHAIRGLARNKNLDNEFGNLEIKKSNYGEKIGSLNWPPEEDDSKSSSRPMGLRGPLVVAGWGYDTDGHPVPNEKFDADDFDDDGNPLYIGICGNIAGVCEDPDKTSKTACLAANKKWRDYTTHDECRNAGECSEPGVCRRVDNGKDSKEGETECKNTAGLTWHIYKKDDCTLKGYQWTAGDWRGVPQHGDPEDHFYFNHLQRPDKWKAGPVDLRWDRDRKVWVGGGGGGGGSGAELFLSKATRCILPTAGKDGKNSFNFGILDSVLSPGRLYRNPCSSTLCEYGSYFPESTMYPDIQIYDPEDHEWCGNCKIKKEPSTQDYYVECGSFTTTCIPFYDAVILRNFKDSVKGIGVKANCGDKFDKVSRGDPQSRRMGDPCHEFGNSIIGEQHPLPTNYKGPMKSLLYKRIFIENPLNQGLMAGDTFISADTGRKAHITYAGKKKGTGSNRCSGENATVETVTESLPIHIILQAEFVGQEFVTFAGCEQGETTACSKKVFIQGFTTLEDCGPNDDYPQTAATY